MKLKLSVPIANSVSQSLYWAKQVREHEGEVAKRCGLSLWQLMEKAGESAFELLQAKWPDAKRILLLVGKGNNAGDAFIVGQLALKQGIEVDVSSPFDQCAYQGDALTAFEQFKGLQSINVIHEPEFEQYDVIIDGLLGTGFRPPLADNFAKLISAVNWSKRPVLSLDLPSGLQADTGKADNPVIKATHTITFVAVKAGLMTCDSSDYCGDMWLAGLAIGEQFCCDVSTHLSFVSMNKMPLLAARANNSHKGSHGFVLALAANKGYPGAGRLCAEASLRAGAAMVAVSAHKDNADSIIAGRPELIIASDDYDSEHFKSICQRATCLVIGPGLGRDEWAQNAWQLALSQNKPMVVDADALNLLALSPEYRNNWILTPHPGEAATLLGCSTAEINADRYASILKIQQKYGGVCLLKGAGTLVTDGHEISVNTSGNAGMASAGMGDVLSGLIAALLAQSENLFTAAKIAAFVHGKAADFAVESGVKGLLASDMFEPIRVLVNQYTKS